MKTLYIGSTSGFAGKNLLTLALGNYFQKQNYKIGYFKPVGAMPKLIEENLWDEDAFLSLDFLGLKYKPEEVTPVLITRDFKIKSYQGECYQYLDTIKENFNNISKDKDIVLVAGSGSFLYSGKYCGLDGVNISSLLQAKVILIDRFKNELNYDYLLAAKEILGDSLLGVVLNDIPDYYLQETNEFIIPILTRNQIKVLGVIPSDPLLKSITVKELADKLGGRIISMRSKGDRVVKSFLIGTMQLENFMTHFKKNKEAAIIVGGDRSDVQLVALEGNSPCLILTGNIYPNDIILTRSEVLGTPIIVVRDDTFTVARKVENILYRSKLREPVKLHQACKLVQNYLNLKELESFLEL